MKNKRPATDWEKTFANYMSNKGPISRMYKNSQNSAIRQHNKNGKRYEEKVLPNMYIYIWLISSWENAQHH